MAVRTVWNDDNNFYVDMAGAEWRVVFSFPIRELSEGASLSRMMTLKVRETLCQNGSIVSAEELKAVSKEALTALRAQIEPYFEARGL